VDQAAEPVPPHDLDWCLQGAGPGPCGRSLTERAGEGGGRHGGPHARAGSLLTLIPRSRHGALHLFITPGTILRWHRDLGRRRWAARSRRNRPGRPPAHRRIVRLVLRMAAGNEHWGYRRIAGELAGLGITVAPSTVWEILKKHGVDPAPRRAGPGWGQFPRSQAKAILALDLFSVGLLDGTKAYVLAAIEHATHQYPDHRRHRSSRRPVDRAAGPEPVHGSRTGQRRPQVRAARPRRHLPRRLRRGIHRGRPADRAQRHPDAPDELDHGAMDRRMPPRALGSHPDLEPDPPPQDPDSIRASSQ